MLNLAEFQVSISSGNQTLVSLTKPVQISVLKPFRTEDL